MLVDQGAEQGVDRVRVTLAGVLRHDVPLRVDQHERRPGPRGIGVPGHQVRVVEHRVGDRVAGHRGHQCVRVGLVHELRAVYADHHQLVGVLLLDRAELVEHVQTVDTAEGPKVEQDEAATEVTESKRAVGIQPAATEELWSADAG